MPTISYKSAVIVAFLSLSLVAIGAVLFNTHAGTSAAVMKLSSQIVQDLSAQVVQRATHAVDSIESYLYVNAEVAMDDTNGTDIVANRDRLLRVFWQQLIHSQPVRAVYIADPVGNMVQVDQDPRLMTRVIDRTGSGNSEQLVYRTPGFDAVAHASRPSDYDPRERPWYKTAKAGQVHWSEVYPFAFSQGQRGALSRGVTASLAVTAANGSVRYVVAADVTLQGVSDFLSAQPMAEAVAMFVVDDQDRLLAYPYQLNLDPKYDTGNGPLPRVEELAQDWIQDAYANYRDRGMKTGEALVTRTDGASYVTTATVFESRVKSDWRLIVIAPKSYLLSSANQILRESLVTSLIILLLALFVIYLVASYLSGPILQLAANSRLIELFRFDEVSRDDQRWSETSRLDDSLRHIATKLRRLAQHVPSELLAQWSHDDKALDPGTEVRDLDLLVAGVDDPSRSSGHLDPATSAEWLPGHLATLADIIHDQRGTLDHFTGDGVVTFWGAPVVIEGGALRACNSALQTVKANPGSIAADGLHSCAAVHSGAALVGNFGSPQRLSYAAIGEVVSTAAALLSLNRRYGTRIIISDATHERIEGQFQCRPLDVVRLSDGGPALPLFELIADRSTQLPVDHRLFIDAYTQAFEDYLRKAWGEALRHLASLPEAYRDDLSVRCLTSRCQALLDDNPTPLPKVWDGVYPTTATPAPPDAS